LLSAGQGFRHRLKLAVQPANDFALAMRQESSHDLVILAHCPIATDGINKTIKTLPALLKECGGLSQLTDMDIDEDTQGEIGLVLRFSKAPIDSVIERLSQLLRDAGVTALAVLCSVDKKSWKTIYQQGHLQLNIQTSTKPCSLAYRPGDFTQTNWALNQQMIETALNWLSPQVHESALDLFAGIGNFSLPLAQQVKQLHGFELSEAMVNAARSNADINQLSNARFTAQDLFADKPQLPDADIAIIDPPRAGAESVCKSLANQTTLTRLVYISCNPATLVRDSAILQSGGLTPVKAAFVDMFAYTGHSEAMVLFVR
jgi:23S rRNA (uracil1939-C5)-methyltransferase